MLMADPGEAKGCTTNGVVNIPLTKSSLPKKFKICPPTQMEDQTKKKKFMKKILVLYLVFLATRFNQKTPTLSVLVSDGGEKQQTGVHYDE